MALKKLQYGSKGDPTRPYHFLLNPDGYREGANMKPMTKPLLSNTNAAVDFGTMYNRTNIGKNLLGITPANTPYDVQAPKLAPGMPAGIKRSFSTPITSIKSRTSPNVEVGAAAGVKPNARGKRKGLQTLNQLAPFVSNMVNAFRKPPAPPMPTMNSQVTLNRVSNDNEINQIEGGVRASNMVAGRTLDENSAAAVRGSNLAERFNQMSASNDRKNIANIGIGNQEAQMNAAIEGTNTAKKDQYGRDLVDMKIANQREKSDNIANAADKYVGIQNEKAKRDLDLKKFGIVTEMYNRDGVASRKYKTLAEFQADPINVNYANGSVGANQAEAMMNKANEDYEKRQKEKIAALTDYKKFGGRMKYATGRMMKVFN